MRITTLAAVVFISWASFSCSPPPPGPGPELEMDAGALQPSPDAGAVADAGEDAGSSTVDAGLPDAGEVDAGTPDAGQPDAGQLDAGQPDAGQPDAGCVCSAPNYCNAAMQCVPDTTPPTLTVSGSAGTTSATIHVQGTAVDLETGITMVSVRINQQAAQSVTVVNGAFDAQLAVPSGRAEFTVDVSGADLAGNQASASAVFDPTAPTIVATPADYSCGASGCTGAFINASTAVITVTASVTELALATSHPVRVRVVDSTGSELVPPTDLVLQGSSWTWVWTNFPNLDDASIDFELTATDAQGNVGTAVIHGAIDRVAPNVTIANADAACGATSCTGTVINTLATSATLSGLTRGVTGMSVRVVDGAASVVAPTAVIPDAQGAWSWTWTNAPLVDGRFYRFEATVVDRLGNTGVASSTVLVDRAAPGLAINSPSPAQLVGTPTISVNASATDGLGVATVDVTAGSNTTPASVNGSGDWVSSLSVPVVDAVSQTLSVRAVDLAGNSRTVTRSYVADRVAPVVTVNGADYDCSGNQCTGMVANAASTSVAFSGTATDGSAITLQKTLVGSAPITGSTDPVTGGAWSWMWSALPANVNGAAYELRLVATDAAGNASAQVVRRVWLDNVIPTSVVPVAGQRNVSRTATIIRFSEPMDVSSVLNCGSFSPGTMWTSYGSADRMNFGFSTPVLANYTYYHYVCTTPRDLAGNVLGVMADAYFLTEPVARGATTIARAVFPGYTYRYPVVAVDSDQQLFVNYLASTATATATEAMILEGSGYNHGYNSAWGAFVTREGEMRVVAETRGADLKLNPTIEHTVSLTSGTTSLARGTQTHVWNSNGMNATFNLSVMAQTATLTQATLDQLRPTLDFRPYSNGTRRGLVAPNVGATAMNSWEENGAWTSVAPAALTNFRRLDGRASVESTATLGQYRVRYYDLDAMSEVGTFGFVRAVTGQPALKRLDPFFGAPVANSGSFMAWMSDTQLTIACSSAPFSPSPVWRPTALSMPQTQTSGLTSAMNASKVVFASEFGGNVYVHSTPVNGCSASPVVTQLAVLTGMKDASVFIDAAGTVWIAAISTTGEVVVHKIP